MGFGGSIIQWHTELKLGNGCIFKIRKKCEIGVEKLKFVILVQTFYYLLAKKMFPPKLIFSSEANKPLEKE